MSEDRTQICETVYRYATGIDTRDWDLYRSIFTDEVEIDFASYSGQPAARMKADEWVATVKVLFTGLDATQHVMTNPQVTIDGDRATCLMYMKAEHFLLNSEGDDWFTLGGYYVDRLTRANDTWRIEAVTLNVFWNRGNRHIMTLGAERGARELGLR
jgi:hypothetical protein